MEHYVVYHNPDVMGRELMPTDDHSIVTNKTVGDAQRSRVWFLLVQELHELFSCAVTS
jgi:hypothetical protein